MHLKLVEFLIKSSSECLQLYKTAFPVTVATMVVAKPARTEILKATTSKVSY